MWFCYALVQYATWICSNHHKSLQKVFSIILLRLLPGIPFPHLTTVFYRVFARSFCRKEFTEQPLVATNLFKLTLWWMFMIRVFTLCTRAVVRVGVRVRVRVYFEWVFQSILAKTQSAVSNWIIRSFAMVVKLNKQINYTLK